MGTITSIKDKIKEVVGGGASEDENPEDGVEVDDDEWLTAAEVKADGGYRETPKRDLYWFSGDELREYERMNASIETDEDFWTWFGAFVKELGVKPSKMAKKERKERGQVGSGSSWSWGWKSDQYESKNYLREMWSGYGYSAASSDLNRKLAIALGAVNTTVQAVRTKAGRYRVQLASSDTASAPTSYTSFDEELVVVSPQPLQDASLEETRGIEITTGWALHEAGHTEHTVDVYREILRPYVLRPASVAGLLCNILEDVRIERLVATDFPGFALYFEWGLEYLWKTTGTDAEGSSIPREGHWATQDLNGKLNWIIRTIRWPGEFAPIVQAAVDNETDPEAMVEFQWWRDWLEEYDTGKVPMRASIIEALARLASDPETEKEMAEQVDKEMAEEKGGTGLGGMTEDQAKEFLKKLIEKMQEGKSPIVGACPSPARPGGDAMVNGEAQEGSKSTLTPSAANEISRLIEEGLAIEMPPPWYQDSFHPAKRQIMVKRPLEDERSKLTARAHDYSRDPLMQRLRGAFVFRPVAAEWTTRLQRNGSVDEEELWRIGVNDFRVFETRTVESKPDTDVTLLVDMSGSMFGEKLELAARLAQLMMLCIRTTNGVSLRVRGHTGDTPDGAHGDSFVYKIWDPGDSVSRLGLIETVQNGNNYDGFAIGWCVDELLDTGRGENQKLLIVLADGIPAGQHYTGHPAMQHVNEVVKKAKSKGVTVIQVAVGIFDESNQQAMFGKDYVVYHDDETISASLGKLLAKFV